MSLRRLVCRASNGCVVVDACRVWCAQSPLPIQQMCGCVWRCGDGEGRQARRRKGEEIVKLVSGVVPSDQLFAI